MKWVTASWMSPSLREAVGLADLPPIAVAVGPVLPFHERRVDVFAGRRQLQRRRDGFHGSKDDMEAQSPPPAPSRVFCGRSRTANRATVCSAAPWAGPAFPFALAPPFRRRLSRSPGGKACLADAAAFVNMPQHGENLLLREGHTEQRRALAFRKPPLAGSATEHPPLLVWPIAAAHRQVFATALPVVGALRILTTEPR